MAVRKIESIEWVRNSAMGNGIHRVTFADGFSALTRANGSALDSISRYDRRAYDVVLTARGTISAMVPVK